MTATRAVADDRSVRGLPIGYFGASTGAAAALAAAASLRDEIHAVVSRGGRPDLAMPVLDRVAAPTQLIVGGEDHLVLDLNHKARGQLRGPSDLVVIPGATHLFGEPGALERVAELAGGWFAQHLLGMRGGSDEPIRSSYAQRLISDALRGRSGPANEPLALGVDAGVEAFDRPGAEELEVGVQREDDFIDRLEALRADHGVAAISDDLIAVRHLEPLGRLRTETPAARRMSARTHVTSAPVSTIRSPISRNSSVSSPTRAISTSTVKIPIPGVSGTRRVIAMTSFTQRPSRRAASGPARTDRGPSRCHSSHHGSRFDRGDHALALLADDARFVVRDEPEVAHLGELLLVLPRERAVRHDHDIELEVARVVARRRPADRLFEVDVPALRRAAGGSPAPDRAPLVRTGQHQHAAPLPLGVDELPLACEEDVVVAVGFARLVARLTRRSRLEVERDQVVGVADHRHRTCMADLVEPDVADRRLIAVRMPVCHLASHFSGNCGRSQEGSGFQSRHGVHHVSPCSIMSMTRAPIRRISSASD